MRRRRAGRPQRSEDRTGPATSGGGRRPHLTRERKLLTAIGVDGVDGDASPGRPEIGGVGEYWVSFLQEHVRLLLRCSAHSETSQSLASDDAVVVVADLQIGKDQIGSRDFGGEGTGHDEQHARPLRRKG